MDQNYSILELNVLEVWNKFKVLLVQDYKKINQNPYIKVIWSNKGWIQEFKFNMMSGVQIFWKWIALQMKLRLINVVDVIINVKIIINK
jgi:hypothetical protein